jgi:hypothetical protein
VIVRRWHEDGECFAEIDDAVARLTTRPVAFNCNELDPPAGHVVYNLDLVGIHCDPARWRGREVWDFALRNVALYPDYMHPKFVPVGWHPSMKRFDRASTHDIDVVFCGGMNPRRAKVLDALARHGFKVVHNPTLFGAARDEMLSRSRLAINMLYHEDGVYPVLRAAHLVANGVPMLSEDAPEWPSWCGMRVPYGDLVGCAADMLMARAGILDCMADQTRQLFEHHPMVVPC